MKVKYRYLVFILQYRTGEIVYEAVPDVPGWFSQLGSAADEPPPFLK